MTIGIDASFLRKPGTGIGQVTRSFIWSLAKNPETHAHRFILYLEAGANELVLPAHFRQRVFLPPWKRDDLVRRWLWERQLAREAERDGCESFLSLYQSGTRLSQTIRHVMVVHDIIPRLFPQYQSNRRQAFYWKTVERGITAAGHIVAVSEHTKRDLIRELHLPTERIRVVSPDTAPIFSTLPPAETIARVLKKYGLVKGYLYHGGGLEVRKNTEALLRAYALLRDREKTGRLPGALPLLVISGTIFPKTNRLATDVRGLIATLGLEKRVRLLGFVPEDAVPALYAGAIFFVYPSLYEGFGLPVLEAIKMGVPVLASNVAALPEVGGEAVLFANPRQITEIASCMERLLTDETLRRQLIAKGQARAHHFSWQHFTASVFRLLTQGNAGNHAETATNPAHLT